MNNLRYRALLGSLLVALVFLNGCGGSSSGASGSNSPNTTSNTTGGTSVNTSPLYTTCSLTNRTSLLMGGSIQGVPLNIAPNSGVVSTCSTMSFGPSGITTDGTNLYVIDGSAIQKIAISTGTSILLAGSFGGTGFADGIGSIARFYSPNSITTDGVSLYIADTFNHTIRQLVIATGIVSTFAGTVGTPGSTDATGTAALFRNPSGITTDGTNLYVSDTNNHTIRKIVIATKAVTTLAGTVGVWGFINNAGITAQFNYPRGITTDGLNLYVADSSNNAIRKIVLASSTVSTVAGSGTAGAADGTGIAAQFNYPWGITTDGTNLYVTDSISNTVRQINSGGSVTTLAGTAGTSFLSTNGIGSAASFYTPYGITTDGSSLYVADFMKSLIRKIQ